ncbi:HIT family protein [Candidatus Uhrbacteria bacterium]|nr:HIT family protein [Candidatus Uhrbacteria bacterium]
MSNDCLFCNIIAKEIPSTPIYEDEQVYAFLDIKPVNPGHTLVVPKKHSPDLPSTDPLVLPALILAVQNIAQAMRVGLGIEGMNITENDGPVAGQLIPHMHFHLMPRYAHDGFDLWHGKPYGSQEEAIAVAEKIRKGL